MILADRKKTTIEKKMKLIRYFKHIDFTSASDQNMMGIAVDMGDFLRTVEMGRQQLAFKLHN